MATTSSTGGLPNIVAWPKPPHQQWSQQAHDLMNLAAWHTLRIGNTGILASPPETGSTQPAGSQANPIATRRYVWNEEPPGSVPFDEQGSADIATLPLDVDVPVVSFTVPHGYDGIIRWISNNLVGNTVPITGQAIIWKILINGRAARNFGLITQQKGTIAQGREISPLHIFSGDLVQYTVMATLGGLDGETVCSLTGYYFPSKGIS